MSGTITIYEKETGSVTGIKEWITEIDKTAILDNIPTETHDYKEEAAPSFEHKWNGEDWEAIPEPIEYALPHIRTRREILLRNCDWTQATDSPLPEQLKKEWAIYRQALRDLPVNYTDTDEASKVVWPEEPE
jgi:hypothetical protein